MAKFALTSKAKKKLSYYNMQISVDKDFIYHPRFPEAGAPPGVEEIYFYKDSPIILTFMPDRHDPSWASSEIYDEININTTPVGTNLYLLGIHLVNICDGDYPLPEVISVVYDDTTFTFTPIPVYE